MTILKRGTLLHTLLLLFIFVTVCILFALVFVAPWPIALSIIFVGLAITLLIKD
jgi:uncharacterized membrane protein YjjP (DUF1212 family)